MERSGSAGMDEISELLGRDYGLAGRPAYAGSGCLNSGTLGIKCSECVRACKNGVYPNATAKNPDYRKCESCGMCAAACPGKAIAPPVGMVRDFLKSLAADGPMYIACEKEQAGGTLQVQCLAALSPEQVACAVLRCGAVISVRPCHDCPRQDDYRKALDMLDRVRRFVGEDLFLEKIQLAAEGDAYAPPGVRMSRRELFTLPRRLNPTPVLSLMPEPRAGALPGLFYAALLRDLIKKRKQESAQVPAYVVPLPAVNDRCYACGVCASACPTSALCFRTLPDGKHFAAVVEAWKCTACGRCADACREKAISGIREMRISHLGPVAVGRHEVLRCSACGKPRKRSDLDGLCGLCRILRKAKSGGDKTG